MAFVIQSYSHWPIVIPDDAFSGGGAVDDVTNTDGSLTIAPTTGHVVASLNTAHSNTWTAEQSMVAGVGWHFDTSVSTMELAGPASDDATSNWLRLTPVDGNSDPFLFWTGAFDVPPAQLRQNTVTRLGINVDGGGGLFSGPTPLHGGLSFEMEQYFEGAPYAAQMEQHLAFIKPDNTVFRYMTGAFELLAPYRQTVVHRATSLQLQGNDDQSSQLTLSEPTQLHYGGSTLYFDISGNCYLEEASQAVPCRMTLRSNIMGRLPSALLVGNLIPPSNNVYALGDFDGGNFYALIGGHYIAGDTFDGLSTTVNFGDRADVINIGLGDGASLEVNVAKLNAATLGFYGHAATAQQSSAAIIDPAVATILNNLGLTHA